MNWKVGDEFVIIDPEKDDMGEDDFIKSQILTIECTEFKDNGGFNDPGARKEKYVWFKHPHKIFKPLWYVSKTNIKRPTKLQKILK